MTPVNFDHYLRFRKRIICEKRSRQAARKKHLEVLKARERHENDAILHQVLSQAPKLSEDEVDLLVIPSGHSALTPLPEDRIRDYTAHLQKTINDALNPSVENVDEKARQQLMKTESRFSEDSELRIISDRLCGMCKGGCCTAGGDTAYVSVQTIRRFRAEHPELSAEQILHAYLSRLSSETVTSACINQTRSGCALPREMRSDTCNGYYCDSLRVWHERPITERNSTVLAIQRCNSNWRRFDLDSRNRVVDVALVRARDAAVSCFRDITIPEEGREVRAGEVRS